MNRDNMGTGNMATNSERLKAFARECVREGDMTPDAEAALRRILDEPSDGVRTCHPCRLRQRGDNRAADRYEIARAKRVVAAGIRGDHDYLTSAAHDIAACTPCRQRFDGFVLRLGAGAFVAAFGNGPAAITALEQPIFEEEREI